MIIRDRFEETRTAFDGDRVLLWDSLPEGARVNRAQVKIEPLGGPRFEEVIVFNGGKGDWGTTQVTTSNAAEVDFHARRTLARVTGAALTNATLWVDFGGVYAQVNQQGAVLVPDDPISAFQYSDGQLPGLTVGKFKLVRGTGRATGDMSIHQITIRSVPGNLTLRLAQQPPFWARPGDLTREETCPDFSAALNAFLMEAEVAGGFYQVPLVVHSDSIARMRVTIEVDYVQQQPALPDGLSEIQLSYDYSSQSAAQEGLLRVSLPAGARVLPGLTTARVRGSFTNSRILYGPTGPEQPLGSVLITTERSQAAPLCLPAGTPVSAVDLLLKANTRSVSLAVNLVEDVDGKPWTQPLLAEPALLRLDSEVRGQPAWSSVPLPRELQLAAGKRYWLMVQSLSGEAEWSVTSLALVAQAAAAGRWTAGSAVAADPVGMQFTGDGGLSWRDSAAPGVEGAAASFLHLRQPSDSFEVPIQLQVGEGDNARRVSLDRFRPLGRVDFNLDFEEVAAAINQVAESAAQAVPQPGETLLNGQLERWMKIGDTLGEGRSLQTKGEARAIAFAPDGSRVYIGSQAGASGSESHSWLEAFDLPCGEKAAEVDLGPSDIFLLELTPDGRRLVAGVQTSLSAMLDTVETAGGSAAAEGQFTNLACFDTSDLRLVGQPLPGSGLGQNNKIRFSNDGSIYLMVNVTAFHGVVRVSGFELDDLFTDRFHPEDLLAEGSDRPGFYQMIHMDDQSPLDLALSPDGGRLFVLVAVPDSTTGEPREELRVYAVSTLTKEGDAQPVNTVPLAHLPRQLSISASGSRLLALDPDAAALSVIEQQRGKWIERMILLTDEPFGFDVAPAAVIAPDGNRAYCLGVNLQPDESLANSLVVLDLARPTALRTISLGESDLQDHLLAVSPVDTHIAVYLAESSSLEVTDPGQVGLFPVGVLTPAEWTQTAGMIGPVCAPAPFYRAAILGDFQEREGGRKRTPSAISQVAPVTGGARYRLSFHGTASDSGAVVEVLWRGGQCGIVQVDRLPFQTWPGDVGDLFEMLDESLREGRLSLPAADLSPHWLMLTSPEGAEQAEVRVSVPARAVAVVDRLSLAATGERVANNSFLQQPDGQLAGWDVIPLGAAGLAITPGDGVVQLRNSSGQPIRLEQAAPFEGGKPFSFAAETTLLGEGAPAITLDWLDAGGGPAGAPLALEPGPGRPERLSAAGDSPAGAQTALVGIELPAGSGLAIRKISLEEQLLIHVPLSFVAQAPGELVITDIQVAYEIDPPAPAGRPAGRSPCAPTMPEGEPGLGRGNDCCCICPQCQAGQDLSGGQAAQTPGGQAAVAKPCSNCGAALLIPAPRGQAESQATARPAAARMALPRVVRLGGARRMAAIRRVVDLSAVGAARLPVVERRPPAAPAEQAARIPLTDVNGIGDARARALAARGIDSLKKLVAARVEDLQEIIPAGQIEAIRADARRLIEEAGHGK